MDTYDSSRYTNQFFTAGTGSYVSRATMPYTTAAHLRTITDTGFIINGRADRTFYYFAVEE
jgi:hypothetical protein